VLLRAALACAVFIASATILPSIAQAQECRDAASICHIPDEERFALITSGVPAVVEADPADWPGVVRAADAVQLDLVRLAGAKEPAFHADNVVIAGTLGRSPRIDALVASGKLDVSAIDGVWEGYLQVVLDNPEPGISRALVIAGADKRGTIFGLYDLAERAGVSPWTWWADVAIPYRPELHVAPGLRADRPRVKYRGIFINDEKPALHGWANHHYGGFNSGFYERVFELILRHKGNYLWPAMWGEAIYDDDPLTGPLADEMGIVIGTSHHEPLGRAHVEWSRYGQGEWDYSVNEAALRGFWRTGMARMKSWETLVTLGMRGDGDEAMTEGTAISLLERIVSDQRSIIESVTGKPASEQPSVWALYKEVQDYYDQGMQVPDDVTLLFADDNWGNIRRLPKPGSERAGGYGVYYHFDYVGGPRNYKWLNTNQIARVWEQMNLAWHHGVRQIWIVNVGDIKPMELPISFFLDHAWNPEGMTLDAMTGYTQTWSAQQFPAEHAAEISEILDLYSRYAARRKHELVDAESFSVVNFDEFRRVTGQWEELAERADSLREELPEGHDDAFVQLVWFPVLASANLYQLYEAVALNRLYAEQGRASDALRQAQRAKAFFARDEQLTRVYHHETAGGKWVHMMSQTHIGYTTWQQPDAQVMPALSLPLPESKSRLGIVLEGDRRSWQLGDRKASLPVSHVFEDTSRWIELFSTGDPPVRAKLQADEDWIKVSEVARTISGTERIRIDIDWDNVPAGRRTGKLHVRSGWFGRFEIDVPVFKPADFDRVGGYPVVDFTAIEASRATRAVPGEKADWVRIRNIGREGDGITLFPATRQAAVPGESDSPRFEYDLHLFETAPLQIDVELSPTLDFLGEGGLKFAVSLDGGAPVLVNVHEQLTTADWSEPHWESVVAQNVLRRTVTLPVKAAGAQTLTLWSIDAPLVFQKLIVSQKPVPQSYLGPPPAQPR